MADTMSASELRRWMRESNDEVNPAHATTMMACKLFPWELDDMDENPDAPT
jgi:hypothetical protein